jgi:prolyl 4-hydroxylase
MGSLSPDEILNRAAAGDADSQYALAALYSNRGQPEFARHWLRRAAALGHADALFTLAGALLTETEGARDRREEAISGLMQAREKGSVAALRVLAALTASGLLGGDGWVAALAMAREACERGEAATLREIAVLLLDHALDDPDGQAFLAAAASGDRLAAALMARRARRNAPTRAAKLEFDRAFEKLNPPHGRGERADICCKPRVTAFRRALGPDICDHLIGASLPRLKREQVLGSDGVRRTHPHRTAWGALLGFGFADLPSVYAGRLMADLAETPYSHGEPLSILRYLPGQEYKVHYDFLSPNDPDLAAHGQRMKTALLYLSEGYVGGETHFIEPNVQFAGAAGDILIFHNADEGGKTDPSSRHAGRPVEAGEKWIASLWLRDRPFLE